jgi:hypothetical protein
VTAVDDLAEGFPPVALDDVIRLASLQVRLDRKYVVPVDLVGELCADLGADFHALEMDGRRLFGYESVYFDTPDLETFRAHRQGRRRRFKLRTRTYTDSGDCLVEVKLKDRRGATVKHRLPHEIALRDRLDDRARAFVAAVLADSAVDPPPDLHPVLRTTYRRATLVDLRAGVRITFDVDLQFGAAGRVEAGPPQVVVETKSAGSEPAHRAFAQRGMRPVRLSKYCVGIALTHPDLAANRWNRVLRREFGWERQQVTTDDRVDSARV